MVFEELLEVMENSPKDLDVFLDRCEEELLNSFAIYGEARSIAGGNYYTDDPLDYYPELWKGVWVEWFNQNPKIRYRL